MRPRPVALASAHALHSHPIPAPPTRPSIAQFTFPFPERVVAVDVKYPLLIAATADKKITIFHLDNPSKPYRVRRRRPLTSASDRGNRARPLRTNLLRSTHRAALARSRSSDRTRRRWRRRSSSTRAR